MKRVVAGRLVAAAAMATVVVYAALAQSGAAQSPAASKEWPTYGHDPGGLRFSPLTQITPANVSGLKVAWVYHMRPAPPPATGAAPAAQGRGRGGSGFNGSQVTPIVIGGTMYVATPYSRVVALDPTSGRELWAYQLPSGNPSTRGVEYWPGDGRNAAADRVRVE